VYPSLCVIIQLSPLQQEFYVVTFKIIKVLQFLFVAGYFLLLFQVLLLKEEKKREYGVHNM
jgi:hypothetical protein